VPEIFGMNFQAVSVGQKLIDGSVKGGYTDAAGTPAAPMLREIEFVDAAIGQMVRELRAHDLLESTTIIVTAKHGQSPVDPHRFFPIPATAASMAHRRRASSPHSCRPPRRAASARPRTTFRSSG